MIPGGRAGARILGRVLLMAATFCLWLAWQGASTTRAFLAASSPAEGEVVRHAAPAADPAGTPPRGPAPVFRYRDAQGGMREAASTWHQGTGGYPVGTQLPIRYETGTHARAEPAGWWVLWGGIAMLVATAIGFFAAGVLLLRRARRMEEA